ncbi:ABC transporter permease [Candidatus Caldatribacterium sp.]|uniref:ABC transporter permease n=1 Tax=Candidatus Caldatribacterium sp. TaxID=2282143 RepID=UPI00299C12C6|nr:ABC transporter permease [Candidatus Caldatribacterium sp.]MDW8081263.1 ABC transporter permease [Candidatus Calescibacterium sp.]
MNSRRLFAVFSTNPVFFVLVGLVVLFSLLYPQRFLTGLNLTTILKQFVTLTLFALGPSMVVVMGSLDLSYVGIWMLGGILVWLLTPSLGLWAILIFPLLGLGTGLFVGVVHAKGKMPSFILTLCLLVVYWGLTAILSGGYSRAVKGYEFITAPLIPYIPTAFLWSLPFIASAVYLMERTRMGVYLYAIGSNEEGAQLAGIPVTKYKIIAFALSGLFTGLGAIVLFQHLGGSVPVELNLKNVVWPLVAIVLGGTPLVGGSGGPQRTILGALTFSVFYRGLYLSLLHPEILQLLVGVLLIVSIVVGARGIRGVEIT